LVQQVQEHLVDLFSIGVRAFQADIEGRCDAPPVATEITLVGSYAVAS